VAWRERVVLVGLLPATLVIGWLLFAPFEAQTQFPPAREGDCGPAVVAVFRQPSGDELRFACAVAGDDRVVAAGVVVVAAAAWALLAPRVVLRQGRRAAVSLWVALAGGVLLLAPFTTQGDFYQASDGATWRQPLSCPAPLVALRYINVDGGLASCADRDAIIRLGAALAAIVVGLVMIYAGPRAPARLEDSTPH
jgi:hypothetical protein